MNIVVCVKGVSSNLVNDELNENLVLNPYDVFALKNILDYKKENPCHVTCLCMGPKESERVLTRCVAMGADEAILLCDLEFKGSDTYATTFVLCSALKKMEYDFIVCGDQAVDGETGQVPVGIASRLSLPCIKNVKAFIKEEGQNTIHYWEQNVLMKLKELGKAVLIYNDFCLQPSVSLLMIKRAQKANIQNWNAEYLNISYGNYGQVGSKTRVIQSKLLKSSKDTSCIEGTVKDKAEFLISQLEKVD